MDVELTWDYGIRDNPEPAEGYSNQAVLEGGEGHAGLRLPEEEC
jgi:hypothetical protein